jgi:hypothetical protein
MASNLSSGGAWFGNPVSANSGPFTIVVPSAGSYGLFAFVDLSNAPACQIPNLTQGAVFTNYGGSSPATVAVSGNSTGINFSFNDTAGQITGISGGVTYSGGLGTVSSTHPIGILCYQDSGYTTLDGSGDPTYITCNNTTYSCHIPSNPSDYILAFYDLAGTGFIAAGDPYIKLGQITPTTTLIQNITFGDTLWP